MITLTEDEAQAMAQHLLKEIDKDKKFDKYSYGEIVAILSFTIMMIGANIMSGIYEDKIRRGAA